MAVFHVELDNGKTYEIETEDPVRPVAVPPSSPSSNPLQRILPSLLRFQQQGGFTNVPGIVSTEATKQALTRYPEATLTATAALASKGNPYLMGLAGFGGRLLKQAQTNVPAGTDRLNVPEALGAGVKEAAIGGAFRFAESGAKFIQSGRLAHQLLSSPTEEANLVRKVRGFFKSIPKRAGEQFGKFAQTQKDIDAVAEEVTEKVGNFAKTNAALKAKLDEPVFRINFETTLKRWLNRDEQALVERALQADQSLGVAAEEGEVPWSFQEAQSLKKVFRKMGGRGFVKEATDLTPSELDALDLYHSTRADQVGSFTGFEGVSDAYHQELSDYRLLKKSTGGFGEQGLPSALRSDFRGETQLGGKQLGQSPEIREAALRQFEKDPQLAQEIARYRGAADYQSYRNAFARRAALGVPSTLLLYRPAYEGFREARRRVTGR